MNKLLIPALTLALAAPSVATARTLDAPVVRSGHTSGVLAAPRNCHVEHTRVTLAARMMGVKSMTTYWCTAPNPRDL